MVYYINLLLILGLAYPLCGYRPKKSGKAWYLAITFGYMWFLATFRLNIGFDYASYIDIYARFQQITTLSDALQMPYEPGFCVLNWGMSRWIHASIPMYGVYSALILGPVAVFIYRQCKDAWLSTWIYVTLSHFYMGMNLIRQSIACGIVLLGYPFLRDKKPVPYFLIVLLGASFHKTALIMIPLYFLVQIPLGWRMAVLYGAGIPTIYLLSPLLLSFATKWVYGSYRDTIYLNTQYGFSAIFLLIPFTLLALCVALRPVWKRRRTDCDHLISLMIISGGIWLFITRHFILERFAAYPYLLAILAVPTALDCLRAPEEDRVRLAEYECTGAAGMGKAQRTEVRALRQSVRDHNKYYWAAVAGFLILTWLYHEFGQYVSGFHNVFPYQSVLG